MVRCVVATDDRCDCPACRIDRMEMRLDEMRASLDQIPGDRSKGADTRASRGNG